VYLKKPATLLMYIDQVGELSDASPNLWKTIRIWLEAMSTGKAVSLGALRTQSLIR
jgi:hypothetical protein